MSAFALAVREGVFVHHRGNGRMPEEQCVMCKDVWPCTSFRVARTSQGDAERIAALEALLREAGEQRNCSRRAQFVETMFNPNGGTCWWDGKRILPALPADACVWCRIRAALDGKEQT